MYDPRFSSDKRDDRTFRKSRHIRQENPSSSLIQSKFRYSRGQGKSRSFMNFRRSLKREESQNNSTIQDSSEPQSTNTDISTQQVQNQVQDNNLNQPHPNIKPFAIILGVIIIAFTYSVLDSDENSIKISNCLEEFKKKGCGLDNKWNDQCSRLYKCMSSNQSEGQNELEYSKNFDDLSKKFVQEENEEFLGGFGTILTQIIVFILTAIAIVKRFIRNQREGNYLGTAMELIRLHGGLFLRNQRNNQNQ